MHTAIKMKKELKNVIVLPENVHLKLERDSVAVKGPLGESVKRFNFKNINVALKDGNLELWHEKATKKEKKIMNSIASEISSMIDGAVKGFEYKLQVCSTHFPVTIKVDEKNRVLSIKNFLGENKDRVVRLKKNVDVKVEGDIIVVKSIDKDSAGQTAADIENATKVSAKDRRIFQDGIWIIQKEKGRRK